MLVTATREITKEIFGKSLSPEQVVIASMAIGLFLLVYGFISEYLKERRSRRSLDELLLE